MQGIIDYLRPANPAAASKRAERGALLAGFGATCAMGLLLYRYKAPELHQASKAISGLRSLSIKELSFDAHLVLLGFVSLVSVAVGILGVRVKKDAAMNGFMFGASVFMYGALLWEATEGLSKGKADLKDYAQAMLWLYPLPGKVSLGLLAASVVTCGGGLFWYATGQITPQSELNKKKQ